MSDAVEAGTFAQLFKNIRTAAGVTRTELYELLQLNTDTAKKLGKPVTLTTWNSSLSKTRISEAVVIDDFLKVLRAIDITKVPVDRREATQKAIADAYKAIGTVAVQKLVEARLLDPWFTVDGYSYSWLVTGEFETKLDKLNAEIDRWHELAIDNRFFLFISVFRAWQINWKNGLHPETSMYLSTRLINVAISYGCYAEASIVANAYLNELEKTPKSKRSDNQRLLICRYKLDLAIACGCLLQFKKAEVFFGGIADEYSILGHSFGLRKIEMEKIRMYSRFIVRSWNSELHSFGHANDAAEITRNCGENFVLGYAAAIHAARESCTALELDTAVRGLATLCPQSKERDDLIKKIWEALCKKMKKQASIASPEGKIRAKDRHQITEIIKGLALRDESDLQRLAEDYLKSIDVADRRHSRIYVMALRRWFGIQD